MSILITAERPDSPAARQLIAELDAELRQYDYPPHSRHAYSIDKLLRQGVVFFVTRLADQPAGCGGLRLFGAEYAEVKRMYVRPDQRGRGLGQAMLQHLASYAAARGLPLLRLETGIYQTDALRLYERAGFQRRPPFGEYQLDPLSVYFEKPVAEGR